MSAPGFEPGFAGPKPAVLSKLYYAPIHDYISRDMPIV